MTGPYDDIIRLPHHVSETRAHMKQQDRAAQFAPFAALTGFGEAIGSTEEKMNMEFALLDGYTPGPERED